MELELLKQVKVIVADTYLDYDTNMTGDRAFDVFTYEGETEKVAVSQCFQNLGIAFLKEEMYLMKREIVRLLLVNQNTN